MIRQALFLHGAYIGSGEYKQPLHRLQFAPVNKLILCPHCGDVWAKVLYTDDTRPDFEFRYTARHQPCSTHQGGSLISTYASEYTEALPRNKEFLLYELNLYLSKPELYWFDGYSRHA